MKKFTKSELLSYLNRQIKTNRHLLGVAAGSGLTAKYAEEGGADFILALSSGYFRQKGISSLAAYLPFSNSNQTVMDFGTTEILPRLSKVPLIFGLFPSDPFINLKTYIQAIKDNGFSGINNYPTVGLIDGTFRKILEEGGISFEQEVEAIRIANELDLFTIAFVFDKQQAIQMTQAGADVICVHFGLTSGGRLGAKKIRSLQSLKNLAVEIFNEVVKINPNIIKMVYGGPINTPIDLRFIYDGTNIDGYIGGSVFERIPAETMVIEVTQSFKKTSDIIYEELMQKVIDGIHSTEDYVDFIKKYITLHYHDHVSLEEIADILHLSRSYVSTLFKKEVGISFTDYLVDFRLNRAIDILKEKELPLTKVAEMVGYTNYAQFSKIFKKRMGKSPNYFIKSNKKTK